MTTALTRRGLLTAALAAGVLAPLGGAARAAAAPGLTLPRPTGPHRIGTVALHLVDRSRLDPLAGPGLHRELMAAVWYPASAGGPRYPLTPWMADAPLRLYLEAGGFAPDVASSPMSSGHYGAPVLRSRGRLPVVVYSHGNNSCRADNTILVQELASHGYVVVTVDHTYDGYTQFPDGRLTVPTEESFTPWDSTHDILFVLDRIADLAAGRNPDAAHRPLPAGLGAAIDPRNIGMFGWSKGATATALVMGEDQRVRAGLSLDGPMQSQPPVTGLDRPFMLMTAEFNRTAEESVEEFWSQLRGWRLNVQADGALHSGYMDHQWLIAQLGSITGMTEEELIGRIGTLDPMRAVRIQQAYPLAFFDLHLRHRRSRLLDGPSRAFPEVRFIA
ncbi:alpha/beta hydrolase family protein [Asanoa siamensis]|uniref:Platelet-activating factor acetylhydrolase n=1 Tax=Asanoa siamensis TaxID=926357 RepID=A0ABQ4D2S9_9ACTN|nr:acetylhydrolase [Asanoa siamensis]GIF77846.1 hypothetical protein Asi02nite_73640 [Asanoa siamensis]